MWPAGCNYKRRRPQRTARPGALLCARLADVLAVTFHHVLCLCGCEPDVTECTGKPTGPNDWLWLAPWCLASSGWASTQGSSISSGTGVPGCWLMQWVCGFTSLLPTTCVYSGACYPPTHPPSLNRLQAVVLQHEEDIALLNAEWQAKFEEQRHQNTVGVSPTA